VKSKGPLVANVIGLWIGKLDPPDAPFEDYSTLLGCKEPLCIPVRRPEKAYVSQAVPYKELTNEPAIWQEHVGQDPAKSVIRLSFGNEKINGLAFDQTPVEPGCHPSQGLSLLILVAHLRGIYLEVSNLSAIFEDDGIAIDNMFANCPFPKSIATIGAAKT